MAATEDKSIDTVPVASSLDQAKILGIDKDGGTKLFPIANIKGDYKGKATPETNPQDLVLAQYYSVEPGKTYPNFKDATNTPITIPVYDNTGLNIVSPFLSWNGSFWETIWSLLDSALLNRKAMGLVVTNGGSVNIDTTAKTITVTSAVNQTLVVQGDSYYQVLAGTENYVTNASGSSDGLIFILYIKSTKKIGLYFYQKVPDFIADAIVLGVLFSFNTNTANLSTMSDITLNGKIKGYMPPAIASLSFGNARIHVDRTNNKIILPTRIFYTKKGSSYLSKQASDFATPDNPNPWTFNLQTQQLVLDTLIFDPELLEANQNPFYIESAAKLDTMKPRSIVVLQMINGVVTSSYNVVDDADNVVISTWDKIGTILGSPDVIIDYSLTSLQLAVSGTNKYVALGSQYYTITTATTDLIDSRTANRGAGLNFVVYKKLDNKLYVVNYNDRTSYQTNDYIFLGTFFNHDANSIQSLQVLFTAFTINGVTKKYPSNSSSATPETSYNKLAAIISQTGGYKINIDITAKTITFSTPSTGVFIVFGAKYYPRPTVNLMEAIQITGSVYAGIFYLYYQISTAKIRCFHYTRQSDAQNEDHVLLGWFYDLSSSSYKQCVTLCREVFFDNIKIDNFGATTTTAAPSGEIIAPSKIFMINGEKLPIYKSSFVRSSTEMANEFVLACLSDSNTDFNYPTFESFGNCAVLDPSKLKSSIKIISKNYTDTTKDCVADILVSKVDAVAKAGQSVFWWCWGDSLTNRGVANITKAYLATLGFTVNCRGTMTNSGQLGEGREGWTWLNLVGADNTHLGDNLPITRLADGEATSTLYQNPFLKLATSEDIAAHPDWCFRNTGSNAEKSYTTDPDKTGDFFIFDAAYYSTQHLAGNVPDVITIALSTNDMTENGASGVANSLFGVEVVLTKIREAFPTVKIGLVPATGRGDNSSAWSLTCDFVNQLNLKLAALGFASVEVIGAWIHMNRHFMFPYSANANLKADGNITKTYTKSESIHFGRDGYLPYAKTMGAYILNVV